MRAAFRVFLGIASCLLAAAFSWGENAKMPVVKTGDIYFIVTIRATSEHGVRQTVEQSFTIRVVSPSSDLAPQILSSATTTFARVGYFGGTM